MMNKGKRLIMNKNLENEKKSNKTDMDSKKEITSRRHFLKKAVYAAPTIVALGALIKPVRSEADSVPPPPPNF